MSFIEEILSIPFAADGRLTPEHIACILKDYTKETK
jgi:hypothetical protein